MMVYGRNLQPEYSDQGEVMRRILALALSTMINCGGVSASSAPAPDASKSLPLDARSMCDPITKFNPPVALSGLEMIDGGTPRLSTDELTIYFFTGNPGDLWLSHRDTLTGAFGAPVLITVLNSPFHDTDPMISFDGLRFWFASNRLPNGDMHLYVSTRTSWLAEFGAPGLAATVNSLDVTKSDVQPSETKDGIELWFASARLGGLGGYDIWHASRSGNGFRTPEPVSELNSSSDDWLPTLSADQLTVYFSSKRVAIGSRGDFDVWVSHRTTLNEVFSRPALVEELNTSGSDFATWLSSDNCRIYGVSYVNGPGRYFVATRQ